MSDISKSLKPFQNIKHVALFLVSSWGKPQGLAFRDGFLHEALDEMSTPPTKKNDTMQSSEKWEGKALKLIASVEFALIYLSRMMYYTTESRMRSLVLL